MDTDTLTAEEYDLVRRLRALPADRRRRVWNLAEPARPALTATERARRREAAKRLVGSWQMTDEEAAEMMAMLDAARHGGGTEEVRECE